MPSLVVESGEMVGAIDDVLAPGSEIVTRIGTTDTVFIVLRQQWVVPVEGPSVCMSLIVRPRVDRLPGT